MNASQFAILADQVRKLPEGAAGRNRNLLKLTDLHAAAAAATALQNAATGAGKDTGVASNVLTPAAALWPGRPEDSGRLAESDAMFERLRGTVETSEFLSLLPGWIREMREAASSHPGTGACTIGSALQLWLWTMKHVRSGEGPREEVAQQAMDELAEALCPLLAARCLALEIAAAPSSPSSEAALRSDLCHTHAAHAAMEVSATCAEIVFGYRRHLRWDAEGCGTCYCADELDELESWMPGIASGARAAGDVIEADGSHPMKAGPCARFDGVDAFTRLRTRLDGCLTGARLARDRAAAALAGSVGSGAASEGSA